MKKVILMLAVAAMASCAKSELAERPTVSVGDVEIVSGSKVESRAPFEGSLDDKAGNSLMAYVYATKLDVANSNAYVSYATANIAAQGYMKFISAATQGADADHPYPVAAVGFLKEKDGVTPVEYEADPQYYPSNDNPLYMVGLVPAKLDDPATDPDVEGWKLSTDSLNAEYVIDGKTDIMTAVVTKMNDNSDIKKTKASTTVYPAFTFAHKLTLVNIKAYTPTAKEQANWGKITKIELIAVNGVTEGVNQTCTVKLEDATATVSGAAADMVTPFYHCALNTDATPSLVFDDLKISTQDEKDADTDGVLYGPVEIPFTAPTAPETVADATSAKYIAYAMIAPFTTKSTGTKITNMKLKIYTEKNEDGIEAIVGGLFDSNDTNPDTGSIYAGSTEGKRFDVTLKFSGKEIVASATVTDWDEKYAGEVEVI